MVADKIKNAGLYKSLDAKIKKGLEFLEKNDFSKMEPGKYEIDGGSVFALVQAYESKPVEICSYEAHKKFIDIQYVAQGEEKIGYAHIGELSVKKEYDEAGDYMLLSGGGNFIACRPGSFLIFWPEDAHMPCVAAASPAPVKKVVVKIQI
jgi:YhcH/YjgK/YiaL family protein